MLTDKQANQLADAIGAHGDQLGGNLVQQKKFLDAQRQAQEQFLREQSSASDKLQIRATRAAVWSAVAAIAAAVAAVMQAVRVGGY